MRHVCAVLAVVALSACGSPEKYQKSAETDLSDGVEGSIGLGLGSANMPWARSLLESRDRMRSEFALGNFDEGLRICDSIIATSASALDTISLNDPRAKLIVIVLTDCYTQAIVWQGVRGDTLDVQRRTREYQALGERVHSIRDSLNRLVR